MVALVFVVAVLAAVSLGLTMLYRWARKFEIEDIDGKRANARGPEDPDGFAHLGLTGAAPTASASRS